MVFVFRVGRWGLLTCLTWLAACWGQLYIPRLRVHTCTLGHFQLGSYRYRSLIEGLYTLL